MLTYKEVYHLPLRGTQGLMQSVLNALHSGLKSPDYTTLCRRRRTIKISLPRRRHEGMHMVVDGTGVKVYGEGEWKVRQHGAGKRRTWRKLHIGVDSQSGLIHSASITAGNVHDSQELPNLLHGGETRLYGDSAYRGEKQRKRLKDLAPKAKDFTNKRAYRSRPLTEADKDTNRRKSSVRSKVEHPFLTLKRIWGFAKVRYRGLAKNANRAFAMLALINLSKWGRLLTGQVRPA